MKHSVLTAIKHSATGAFVALSLCAPTSQALAENTLLFEDNFSYEVGNLYKQGPWVRYSSAVDFPVTVLEGGLSYAGYQNQAVGNRVHLGTVSTAEDLMAPFNDMQTVSEGSVYVSFLMNVVEASSDATKAAYFFSLLPKTGNPFVDAGNASEYAKLYITPGADADHFKMQVSRSGAVAKSVATTQEFEIGKTHLVVLQYEIVEGNQNDLVHLWVDPETDSTRPAPLATSNVSEGTNDLTLTYGGILAMELRQGGTSKFIAPSLDMDALRAATNWADLFTVSAPAVEATYNLSDSTMTLEPVIPGENMNVSTILTGSGITSDITVTCPEGVTCDKPVITPEEANAPEGVLLSFTFTAPETEGEFTKVVTLSNAEAGEKNFTISGSVLKRTDDVDTGVSTLRADSLYTVYNSCGLPVMKTSDMKAMQSLPAGLYIVNGRKHLIK